MKPSTNILSVFISTFKTLIALAFIALIAFGIAYAVDINAYVEANSSNQGIVTDKSYETDTWGDSNDVSTKYYVTIARQKINASGEVSTETQTYTISFEDWSQIEVGHIATFNDDDTVTVDPPKEGETLQQLQPIEPYDLSFIEFVQEKTTGFFTTTFPEFFSDESTILAKFVVIFISLCILGGIYAYIKNDATRIAAEWEETAAEMADEDGTVDDDAPWDNEEEDEDEDEEEGEDEDEDTAVIRTYVRIKRSDDAETPAYSQARPTTTFAADETGNPYHPDTCEEKSRYAQTCANEHGYEKPSEIQSTNNHPQSNQNQETGLTVRQIRALVDSLSQIEITENYTTRASGYNSSLTKDYDDRPVTKISVSNGYSSKIVLDITPKSF